MWKVTHIVPRPPEPDALVQLVYFTISDEADGYFCGQNLVRPHTKYEIDSRVERKRLVEIDWPTKIVKGQAVWLTPENNVFIASKEHPMDDTKRIKIKSGENYPNIFSVQKSIQERVESKREDSVDDSREIWTLNKNYVSGDQYNKFVKCVVENLENLCGAKEKTMNQDHVRWDFIPTYLYDGYFDFCYDPYFRTESRGKSANVVQFGIIDEVQLFVEAESDLYIEIAKCNKAQFSLKETIKHLHINTKLDKIIVYGECVSSMEVVSMAKGNRGISLKIHAARDEVEMRHLIDKDHGNRLIVADIGLIKMLHDVDPYKYPTDDTKKQEFVNKNINLKYIANEKTKFKMSRSYPVGFVYPVGDERWKGKIESAIKMALTQCVGVIDWENEEGGSVKKDLIDIGVKLWPLKDLCEKMNAMDVFNLYKENRSKAKDKAEQESGSIYEKRRQNIKAG